MQDHRRDFHRFFIFSRGAQEFSRGYRVNPALQVRVEYSKREERRLSLGNVLSEGKSLSLRGKGMVNENEAFIGFLDERSRESSEVLIS